jgi:hypothetical protein
MNGILTDENYDLVIKIFRENGLIVSGLVVGDNVYQCVKMIVEAQKGEFKEVPSLGFGIDNYLKSPDTKKQQFVNELTKELESAGFKARVELGKTLLDFNVIMN